ncbi:hypothetical protein F485_gp278 [Aeromonas phage CC2]|uniref:Uncharacterized protein n=1 Tax=Aeromonas phage CC2 TaxID=1204516 RepID=I6WLT5_9CAUD|nr:hypothetical protein F485_gp278 [Aeromonas phage CC2]AFN39168.1 hypothetical protein CC2_017 [Aeromonas phage CC2]
MNVIVRETNHGKDLIYSHDDGFTRHVVQIYDGGYACYLNESRCFKRKTHELMMTQCGIDPKEINPLPWNSDAYYRNCVI